MNVGACAQPQPVIAGTLVTRSKQQFFLALLYTGVQWYRTLPARQMWFHDTGTTSQKAATKPTFTREGWETERLRCVLLYLSLQRRPVVAVTPLSNLRWWPKRMCPGAFVWKTRIGTVKYWGHYDDISEKEVTFAGLLLPIRKPVEMERMSYGLRNETLSSFSEERNKTRVRCHKKCDIHTTLESLPRAPHYHCWQTRHTKTEWMGGQKRLCLELLPNPQTRISKNGPVTEGWRITKDKLHASE